MVNLVYPDPFGNFVQGYRQAQEDARRNFETWLKWQSFLLKQQKTLESLALKRQGLHAKQKAAQASSAAAVGVDQDVKKLFGDYEGVDQTQSAQQSQPEQTQPPSQSPSPPPPPQSAPAPSAASAPHQKIQDRILTGEPTNSPTGSEVTIQYTPRVSRKKIQDRIPVAASPAPISPPQETAPTEPVAPPSPPQETTPTEPVSPPSPPPAAPSHSADQFRHEPIPLPLPGNVKERILDPAEFDISNSPAVRDRIRYAQARLKHLRTLAFSGATLTEEARHEMVALQWWLQDFFNGKTAGPFPARASRDLKPSSSASTTSHSDFRHAPIPLPLPGNVKERILNPAELEILNSPAIRDRTRYIVSQINNLREQYQIEASPEKRRVLAKKIAELEQTLHRFVLGQ